VKLLKPKQKSWWHFKCLYRCFKKACGYK